MRTSLTLTTILFCGGLFSQNIGINTKGQSPHVSALLDINADSLADGQKRGFLVPRVALTAKNVAYPVITPTATSLIVYNTDSAGTPPNDVVPGFYYWDVSVWKPFIDTVYITVAPPPLTCPPGFVRVPGQNYCIEINERPLSDWDMAETTCRGLGYRLCDFSEWRTACFNQNNTEDNLGNLVPLQNMVGNYEWTNVVDGTGDGVVAGSGSCTNVGGISIYTISPRFRCCFSPCGP